ncbi:phosphatidate cytidylyltransferase [Oceanithermus sp.]|uniref:phosphatidate cytidylyltransferase n=1 Tax=Oceanithermus sp. TaxID=2268145 RepID=UPI002579865B|nr:phosphatidate cytidylyltransferase [Oceanithermus sp.]
MVLFLILWVGLPLLGPALVLALWIGTGELAQMFARKSVRLNLWVLRLGGLLLLTASLPALYEQNPGVPWREVALGLVLFSAFIYELFSGADIPRLAFSVLALLYLPWTLGYFLLLRYSPDATLGLVTLSLPLVATFATDVGAYFVGRTIGRTKLAPTVSPNKTVEGFVGGLVAAFLALFTYTWLIQGAFPFGRGELLVFAVLLSFAAQLGDLTESMLKRYTGVKDSGQFLPGHGGLLDRLDSLIFSVPLTYYLLVIFT